FAEHLASIATGPHVPGLVAQIDFTRLGRHVLLTFDDGGKSAVYTADELSRRGWQAHFFIVTSLIGTRTFVDARDIRYLRSCGHVVAGHSRTPPAIFRDETPERMLEEWRPGRVGRVRPRPATVDAGAPLRVEDRHDTRAGARMPVSGRARSGWRTRRRPTAGARAEPGVRTLPRLHAVPELRGAARQRGRRASPRRAGGRAGAARQGQAARAPQPRAAPHHAPGQPSQGGSRPRPRPGRSGHGVGRDQPQTQELRATDPEGRGERA